MKLLLGIIRWLFVFWMFIIGVMPLIGKNDTSILNAIIYLVLGVIVAVVPFMIKRKEKGNNTNGK